MPVFRGSFLIPYIYSQVLRHASSAACQVSLALETAGWWALGFWLTDTFCYEYWYACHLLIKALKHQESSSQFIVSTRIHFLVLRLSTIMPLWEAFFLHPWRASILILMPELMLVSTFVIFKYFLTSHLEDNLLSWFRGHRPLQHQSTIGGEEAITQTPNVALDAQHFILSHTQNRGQHAICLYHVSKTFILSNIDSKWFWVESG